MPKYSFEMFDGNDVFGVEDTQRSIDYVIDRKKLALARLKNNSRPNRAQIADLEYEIAQLVRDAKATDQMIGIPKPGELTVSVEPTEEEAKRLKEASLQQGKPLKKKRGLLG